MKKMRITLNDKIYDVTVEILEDDEQHYPGAGPTLHQPTRTTTAARPSAPARPVAASAANTVLAPIVGTVTKILATIGQQVKANEPLVILDAMKMDTYINSPRAGTVLTIDCQVGASVSVGQKLLTLN